MANFVGTKFVWPRITNQKLRCSSNRTSSKYQEAIMDAKWNKVIDNFAVRAGMLVLAFGVWLAIAYGVLAA